ncbi:hypothetical protein FisN_21Lh079 [Fistulifera solaris]|uniref:Calcineurin-like phosphoesterase domain-containing protein n=1 Tax=Fistulifera solaris TaxID=1519565 RepID=A0A1Z5KJX1_FISSO|nr:hypothetical protein FisN_21Lh079 [Fistulifera solaris]|eukprot:GAX26610.1 hypothetical protein FisN_21Lh079 [Fistulifera solaris]
MSSQSSIHRNEGNATYVKRNITTNNEKMQDDISRRLAMSKDRTLSERPPPSTNADPKRTLSHEEYSSILLPPPQQKQKQTDAEGDRNSERSFRKQRARLKQTKKKPIFDRRSPQPVRKSTTALNVQPGRQGTKLNTYSSLLPPLTPDSSANRDSNGELDDEDDENDPLSSGLSSWEEFLGVSPSKPTTSTRAGMKNDAKYPRKSEDTVIGGDGIAQQLPSIQDLFPSTMHSSPTDAKKPQRITETTSRSALDGVLPVSALFYRSSQQQKTDGAHDDEDDDVDDEELPFSAEQSGAVSSENNKVRIRRNLASKQVPPSKPKRSSRGRKLVRRGMEMLVGGVPINADPPQRGVELYYQPTDIDYRFDWAKVVSLNSRVFGPLLYAASIPKVSPFERGLFCEYWTSSALKWDICPKDLRRIARDHYLQQQMFSSEKLKSIDKRKVEQSSNLENTTFTEVDDDRNSDSSTTRSGNSCAIKKEISPLENGVFETEGECTFEVGLSQDEIESASYEIFESVFSRAFTYVIEKAVRSTSPEAERYTVDIPSIKFVETDEGYIDIHVGFTITFNANSQESNAAMDTQKRTKRINEALQQAMDDGEIALELARAAQEESRWPDALRDRIVEECLFQDDAELLNEADFTQTKDTMQEKENSDSKPDLKKSEPKRTREKRSTLYTREDMFSGGGTDGVFYNFSAGNALNAPYGGQIGLRLVDAVVERAKQRQPRVIAIGDVHGCIDELQDLLRECDYRPGDLVVFLGDLVCKGPDSISVVQMAREIGAIGVRGNHDFEVVRWHQAIISGVDPPVVRSEHYHIASCLSKADMKWMYSLPWYVSSQDLSTLFVHAGFVSGIRLAKQNPRLMMNMRSILPDGTVTSKFFNNWPWARLWDGPQTVLFGHDADRGLQQYEHAIGLDTGCVYGGRLTACILPEKRLVSVSARREYFKYRRKHYD